MNDSTRRIGVGALRTAVAAFAALGLGACTLDGSPILAGDASEAPDEVEQPADDAGPDGDAEADADADADAEADTEAETDANADGDAEADGGDDAGDGGPPCEPVLGTPFEFVPSAADEDERAVVLDSGEGFVVLGRAPGPVLADGLRLQRLDLDGSPTAAAPWMLASVELSPEHPMLQLPGGDFAVTFAVTSGAGTGVWVKIVPSSGTGGMVPLQVPDTDDRSSQATIAFDGTDLIVVWLQTLASGAVDILAQRCDRVTGEALLTTAVTLASVSAGAREPRIVWGGYRLALVYIDLTDAGIRVRQLDASLGEVRNDLLLPPDGEALVGAPALAWSGTEFGVAWETALTASARIHLSTFLPDGIPTDRAPLDAVIPLTSEPGWLALVAGAGGTEWGLAWSRVHPGRTGIHLARIAAADFSVVASVDMRPESVTALRPSIAYNSGSYAVAWTEVAGMSYPIYVATSGCTP